MKKAYWAAEFEYIAVRKEDIITISGGEENDTPVTDNDDVNSELPFVPKK